MIKHQIHTWDVLDRNILGLFDRNHREQFMPETCKNLALADMRIPIGHGQTTMTPKVEARLLQSLTIRPHEKVLEIGTGSAWLTVLLASCSQQVKSIDIFPDFIHAAEEKIAKAGLDNVQLENIDAYNLLEGNEERHDVVVLTASLPVLDPRFLDKLNDGGRAFIIIGQSPAMEACVITKQTHCNYAVESLFEIDFPVLIGAEVKDTFSF